MVDEVDDGLVAGELEAFEHVIPYDEQGGYTAQTIEQGVMRFGVVCLHYLYFILFLLRVAKLLIILQFGKCFRNTVH